MEVVDDGVNDIYVDRIRRLKRRRKRRHEKRVRTMTVNEDDYTSETSEEDDWGEAFYCDESDSDVEGKNGFVIPAYIYNNLHQYQREGVQWLYDLHERNTGGILGDEMGLGKTVQIVAFFACIHKMYLLNRAILVCPGSVLFHWVREFHKWCPDVRVVVFHRDGTALSAASHEEIVSNISENGGVIILTYAALRQYQRILLPVSWDYAVLDEGHRIRNPDADITVVCKQLRTAHRIILTGTPIQNHLRELWSLFDFVFPGRLGTLPTFDDEFVLPIRHGAYINASKMQIYMAYKCARMLQDLINPFLLRRTKKELNLETKLSDKTEHILFCHLTLTQREAYETYIGSSEVNSVINRVIKPFRAITMLRKLCNHVDLPIMLPSERLEIDRILAGSGKMAVVNSILPEWFKNGHRVLLFSQTRRMLDILEAYVHYKKWKYCRLDGTTPMKRRQNMIDTFNNRENEVFVFLLTTRAGGIGINLMGADRVLIFDPDWNPSTDIQARERAWRLGQTRDVTIYRLITCGAIEEKIYHRQIFKQYLTDKVLKDPKKRRKFSRNNLLDLFSLSDAVIDGATSTGTETGDLFLAGHIEASQTKVTETDKNTEDENQSNISSASSILQKLFDGGDIRSIFSHDAVEDDGISNQETSLVDMEASKIAADAVKRLKQSESMVCQRNGVHAPTWTGRTGSAGSPSAISLTTGSASSSGSRDLLKRIRKRKSASDLPQGQRRVRIVSSNDLAKELQRYLQQRPNSRATTKQIVHEFDSIVKSENKIMFRELLRKMATCKNQVWTLKEDYSSV